VKFLRFALLLSLLAGSVRAEENRYDLLGRLLRPFVNVFAQTTSNPNRAFSLTARLEQMTDLPPALVGSKLELAVQYPDKLRLHAPVLGEDLTICRHGQEVWVYPGSKVEALLQLAATKKKLPKADQKFRLESFALPIPEQQLALLPALFQIKDVGSEPLDGESCRVLDLFLMPALAKSLKATGWAARVWARGDARPARLSVARDNWNFVVRFDQVEFAPKLPDSTWEPTPEQAADVLKLDPVRYQQLLGTLVK
jgi:outer membrane lipoprotein-sorting protein